MAIDGRESEAPESAPPTGIAERARDEDCPECDGSGHLASGATCQTCGWSDEGGAAPASALADLDSPMPSDGTAS